MMLVHTLISNYMANYQRNMCSVFLRVVKNDAENRWWEMGGWEQKPLKIIFPKQFLVTEKSLTCDVN